MSKSPWILWGAVVGFALGGFFDGILLHQILQWHHLLSLVPDVGDIRMQVLWDGYFHALMYVLALTGLWGLWRSYRRGGAAATGRALAGALLVGFGTWHVFDGVVSHWLLGIHRIRLDSDAPLAWDLLWLGVFGLLPIAAAWPLFRQGRGAARPPGGPMAAGLGLLVLGAAAWSMAPPRDQAFTTVVFSPGVEPAAALDAILAADARLVWATPDLGVVVLEAPDASRWRFHRAGALLVSGSGLPAGCFNWSRA